jgi:dTDP-4-amino-4,6-dideoxygalactose transaminase
MGERPLGSFGDAAIFSIRKTLPLEHAGALVLRNGNLSNAAKRRPPHVLSTLGTISFSAMRHFELRGKNWSRSLLLHARKIGKVAAGVAAEKREWMGGDNFVLSHADVGMSRLTRMIIRGQNFPMIVERRRRNFLQLLSRLGKFVQPVHDSLPSGVCPISYAFQHEKKHVLLKRLQERHLDANIWESEHPAVPGGMFPEAERMRRTMLQLPCHQDLTPEAIDWLADQVCDALQDLN